MFVYADLHLSPFEGGRGMFSEERKRIKTNIL